MDLPGEYNYQPNAGAVVRQTVPLISSDDRIWRFADRVEYDAKEPRLRIVVRPDTNRFWIAHTPPYTNQHLARLMSRSKRSFHFRSEVIGQSVEKRPLYLWTITDRSVPDAGKRVIWLMARQHSWESFTSWVLEGAVRQLLGASDESRRLRREAIWKILPAADPDGLAHGGVRFNRNGFDLNRNWDIEDPIKMPEIAAQRAAIRSWVDKGRRLDLLLSLHNTETNEYLEGPPEGFRELGWRFFELLKSRAGLLPARSVSFAAASVAPGRMNVSQGLWHDRNLPAFISEQRVTAQPGSGRLLGVADRVEYGEKLPVAMLLAVQGR